MYDVQIIAAYIIYECHMKNIVINNIKLQAILYFVQAEFLVDTGTPCFRESIEAWPFGAVVPIIYNKYRRYGWGNIMQPCSKIYKKISNHINEEAKDMIDMILIEASRFSAIDLIEMIRHQSPWIKAFTPNEDNTINLNSIKKFFQ